MSDDDDDEVALGDEGGDDAETGLPADTGTLPVIERKTHRMSSKSRELLQAAVNKLKAEREPDEDELEPVLESPAVQQETSTTPGQATSQPANAAPPVPSLDADVQRARAEVDERHKKLDEREQALTERERAADLQAFADRWIEGDTIGAVRELLKSRGIAGTDDEWKDEAAELITDLTEKVFGTKVDQTLRNTIDVRRAKRANSYTRQKIDRERTELEQRRVAEDADRQWGAARDALGKELGKDEHKTAYPFLSALDNAPQVVMELVQKEAQAGRSVTWQEAAKTANDYIHDQVAQHDKRWRPLLEKVSALKPNGSTAASGRPSGTSQVTQPPKPTTQAPQSQPQRPQLKDRDWNETRRKQSLRKLRAAFKEGA